MMADITGRGAGGRLALENFPPPCWRYSRTQRPMDLARVLSVFTRYG